MKLTINFFDDPTGPYTVNIGQLGYVLIAIPRNKIYINTSYEHYTQGIYFLVNAKESRTEKRYLYIGQTKTGIHRLLDHKNKKEEWDTAYMFLGDKIHMPLQIVDELEAIEINKYKNNPAFNLVNLIRNNSTPSADSLEIAETIEKVMTFFRYGSVESQDIYKESLLDQNISISPKTESKSLVKDDIDFLNKNNLSNGFSYNLYLKIQDFINNKYENFSFMPTKNYINILTPEKKIILSIIVKKSCLKIYFTLDNLNEYDKEKKLVDYKNIGHWSSGRWFYRVENEESLEYLYKLIDYSYTIILINKKASILN